MWADMNKAVQLAGSGSTTGHGAGLLLARLYACSWASTLSGSAPAA